jgi:hypothetical protein
LEAMSVITLQMSAALVTALVCFRAPMQHTSALA